jgi:hypothetical protein
LTITTTIAKAPHETSKEGAHPKKISPESLKSGRNHLNVKKFRKGYYEEL